MPDKSNTSEIDEAEYFHEGLRLFNTREWFEAHEVWEDIWHLASGEKKRFYQGLIQAAVIIEHVRRGNPRGVRAVYKTCLTKFNGIHGVYMGVDVDDLQKALTHFIKPILDLPADRFSPALGRGQDLPVELQHSPRIELKYNPFENDNSPSAID